MWVETCELINQKSCLYEGNASILICKYFFRRREIPRCAQLKTAEISESVATFIGTKFPDSVTEISTDTVNAKTKVKELF
jgi:hypothetical protein